jgi:CRISPR-associated protein Cmr1
MNHAMKILSYHLSFVSPAFMGNAEQNAQWRTPPIKALLRQWWRVAYAAEKKFAVSMNEMRSEEGMLFGHARLENDSFEPDDKRVKTAARKSEVRIRLSHWNAGTLTQWQSPAQNNVNHPEVKTPVGSDLYLGFGPLFYDRNNHRTSLKAKAAIQAGESAILSLAVSNDHAPRMEQALWLMDRYGTLGGRSRNGWGSFSLTPENATPALIGDLLKQDLTDTIKLDWPHAIARDKKGALIWKTEPHNDWQALMKTLATLKIGLRTKFSFTTGKNAEVPEDRHWLSYPVTNHSVHAWGNNARLPNTLRFKIRKTPDGKLVGVVFHLPHQPPATFNPKGIDIEDVWHRVHTHLDDSTQKLTRIPE